MKTMMVDMDNVITDGMFINYINEYMKTNYRLEDLKDFYYVQGLIGDKDGFWEWVSNKNFYENAPLIEGCYDALKELNERFDVYIVTTYLWNEAKDISGINMMNKYYYLRETLPFIAPEKYIFASNKKIMNFDIRIDDRVNNLDGDVTKLLFTAWHNKDISEVELKGNNIIRVNNWGEILKELQNQ